VVDDETVVRDGVRRTLESQGYRVVMAADGAEGVAVFSQHATEIRAVLTDMMMPDMNGPTMIAVLRHMEPRLVILGMTGLPERTGVKGLESLDLPAVLTKPFSSDELMQTLH
jgi:CheY-like chemotaxis protein